MAGCLLFHHSCEDLAAMHNVGGVMGTRGRGDGQDSGPIQPSSDSNGWSHR